MEGGAGGIVRLDKIKRPAGPFTYEMAPIGRDTYGVWLAYLRGARWRAPHDEGTMPFDAVVLLAERRPWVVWWVDDPDDRRIEVDICLPPRSTDIGWTFVDLELDPVRHEADGRVVIEDEDELLEAVAGGWVTPPEAALARATAGSLAEALRSRQEPFGEVGWRRLDAARRPGLEG